MKFRLALYGVGTRTEALAALALRAEAAGFDGVLLGDHVVMPAVVAANAPYTRDGRSPMDFATPWPECLSAMAFLLGAPRLRTAWGTTHNLVNGGRRGRR